MELLGLGLVLMLASQDVVATEALWSVDVPKKISAVRGSDVVVPCSFSTAVRTTNAVLFWKTLRAKTHFPYIDRDNYAFVYHPNVSFEMPKYQGRTSLLGLGNNCSLKIQNIQESESSLYLRVVSKEVTFSSWEKLVSISVEEPGAAPTAVTTKTELPLPFSVPTITPATGDTEESSSNIYIAIFVPLLAILFLAAAIGFLVHMRCRSFGKLGQQESSRYVNFRRTDKAVMEIKIETLKSDKELPVVKNIDEPVYVNYSEPRVAPAAEDADNIYANVDYT